MRAWGLSLPLLLQSFCRWSFDGQTPGFVRGVGRNSRISPPQWRMAGYAAGPTEVPAKLDEALVWVDCEMTGLGGGGGPGDDTLLEVAVIITDGHLNVVAEGPDLVVHHPDEVLNGMNDWCKKQFGWDSASKRAEPGNLAEQVQKSTISLAEADGMLYEFLSRHVKQGKGVLAGNTVHMDKRFLDKFCPRFTGHMHYRLVDVSTIKELSRRWFPAEFDAAPRKRGSHRALDDIRESLQELQYYKEAVFKRADRPE
ncbi:Oligoribonuclease, mitochondrial [Symbiodinium microadriaticum]|uniref:Oligoribonuclease, mitochondrial n=2 Tax=Symbiodinium TaxID=2949 RepID=A0A1Q9CD38_SYMMI|nr:Oligoribonuclease, mitochondrial [Symbiodinium microadriaticum]